MELRRGALGKIVAGIGCAGAIMVIAIGGPGLFLGVALWSASERTIYSRQASPDGR